MITYVRARRVKAGKFQDAISFLKEYSAFIESELDQKLNLGVEMGRLGTVISSMQFDNAQDWENAMNKLRSNPNYVAILDQSSACFEDEVREHLIQDLSL